jgi:TMEM175 potassium channel family protein
VNSRRLESFSDGVFAVAITVLVFDLLPIGRDAETAKGLTHALLSAWPQYSAYAISFLTIGIMWLNHHTMAAHLRRVDRGMLLLNLLLLTGVVALPFPTALVADHLEHSGGEAARVATVAYGLVMIVISIAFASMWVYLISHQATLARGGTLDLPRHARLRFTGGLWGYVAGALAAAFWSAAAGLVIYALLAVYYVFENLPTPSAEEDGAADGR